MYVLLGCFSSIMLCVLMQILPILIYCTILMRLQFITLELVNAFQNITITTQCNTSQHFAFMVLSYLCYLWSPVSSCTSCMRSEYATSPMNILLTIQYNQYTITTLQLHIDRTCTIFILHQEPINTYLFTKV